MSRRRRHTALVAGASLIGQLRQLGNDAAMLMVIEKRAADQVVGARFMPESLHAAGRFPKYQATCTNPHAHLQPASLRWSVEGSTAHAPEHP